MCYLDYIRHTRFCIHFTKYETFVNILGVLGIILNAIKVVVVGIETPLLLERFDNLTIHEPQPGHGHGPKGPMSPLPFCIFVILLGFLIIVMEVILLYCVRKRKLFGIQHWMFAMVLIFLLTCLAAVITTGILKSEGLILSLSLLLNLIRIPPQTYYVHKFITTEKLDADHPISALYVKF